MLCQASDARPMPVPTYDKFIEPLLRHLARHPKGVAARDAHEAAATALGLTEFDREELLPSGVQRVYKNRAGWAHDRLKRAGYSASPRRGFWQLSDAGLAFERAHRESLNEDVLGEIATGNDDVRLRPETEQQASDLLPPIVPPSAIASPDDRLEAAVAELRATTTAELLETLGQVSPKFFETIVLDVLHRIGYGTSRGDLAQVGRSGDGGIDGVTSLDRLGLEKVYVQAKRWQNRAPRGRSPTSIERRLV